jgi:hypothetical protein
MLKGDVALMIPAFVLVTGVLVILVVGAAVLAWIGMAHVLTSLVPLAPWLVMVGTIFLILTELLLFFGDKLDRQDAWRDLSYLLPTLIISAALWYLAQWFLW